MHAHKIKNSFNTEVIIVILISAVLQLVCCGVIYNSIMMT